MAIQPEGAAMKNIRSFFLTMGIWMLAVSVGLLVLRPEPVDMRFRDFVEILMYVSFFAGFLFLLVFSNKWRKINIFGTVLFGLGILVFYLAGRFGGQTVGTPGWGIGLILIGCVFPASLLMLCISGIFSLISITGGEPEAPGVKTGFYAGLAFDAVILAVILGVTVFGPNVDRLKSSLQDPDEEVRVEAIQQLGKLENDQARKVLIKLLKNPDPVMRAEAAWALGKPKSNPEVMAPLTEALQDENSKVRQRAAFSLGVVIRAKKWQGYKEAVDTLIGALKDQSPEVRAAAAESLGLIREERAVEPLIELLSDEEVRFQAYNALLTITDTRLNDDPEEWRAWLKARQ